MRGRMTSLGETVVETVADAEDTDPVKIRPVLAEVVDPDALDALFRTESGRVTFDYCGYRVTVSADRTVDVTPLAGA